jgi:hypothetical protein
MTRARDIADLVDSNGDIVAGALDNVPAADLVNDTTPQLGGALDAQSNDITNTGEIGMGIASPQSYINSNTKVMHLKHDNVNGAGVVMESDSCITEVLAGNNASYIYNYTPDPMVFGTNNTEQMRISSSGVVTMPKQPAFTARHATLSGVNITSHSEMGSGFWYGAYEQDNGNNFNGSTGRFTAPVAGYYFFSHHCRTDSFGGSYLYHSIMKNGSILVGRNLSSFTYSYNTKACSGLTYLAVNDYVSVYTQSTGDSSINFDADGFFSGFLIG